MSESQPDTAKALEKLRREMAENPDSARAHLRLGTALLSVSAKEAEVELRRAVEIDPECAQAWVNLGGIMMQRLDFKGCVEVNTKAISVRPELVAPHYNKGLGHLYLNQPDEMVSCFERVIELDPKNAQGHYHLAVGLLALGRAAEAQQRMTKATALGFQPEPAFMKELGKQLHSENPSPAQVFEVGPDGGGEQKQ